MNHVRRLWVVALVAMPVVYFGGCRQNLRIPFRFELGEELGTFEATAGQVTQNSGTASLGDRDPDVGSGAIRLDPDDITFLPEPNGGGKGTVHFQSAGSFTVTAAIAAVDDLDTVCETPVDSYGPFTVTLNAASEVEAISPSSIELEPSTIDIINEGEFSLCLTVVSTVDGTVVIEALSFSLGL